MAQQLDPEVHTIIDPVQTDIKFTPIVIDDRHYQMWQELDRWYIRRHGEEAACAGPFRTKEALDKWVLNPDREYKTAERNGNHQELPMSHPHKPIVTNQCIDEIRRAMRAGETALSVCGFNVTAQAADESYLLSCPKTAAKVTIHVRLFLGDDDYAHTAWKQFLSEVNKAGLGAGLPHITRVARKPAPKGKVIIARPGEEVRRDVVAHALVGYEIDRSPHCRTCGQELKALWATHGKERCLKCAKIHDSINSRYYADRYEAIYRPDRGYTFPLATYQMQSKPRAEYGTCEADRRSQSCPGWLRWETIKVQPAPLTLVKGAGDEAGVSLAEQKAHADGLASAATLELPPMMRVVNEATSRFSHWRMFPKKTPKLHTSICHVFTIKPTDDNKLMLYHDDAPDITVEIGEVITYQGQRRWKNNSIAHTVQELYVKHGYEPVAKSKGATMEDAALLQAWIKESWDGDPRPTHPWGLTWFTFDGYVSLRVRSSKTSVEVGHVQTGPNVSLWSLKKFLDRTGVVPEKEAAA